MIKTVSSIVMLAMCVVAFGCAPQDEVAIDTDRVSPDVYGSVSIDDEDMIMVLNGRAAMISATVDAEVLAKLRSNFTDVELRAGDINHNDPSKRPCFLPRLPHPPEPNGYVIFVSCWENDPSDAS